jgi:hypothetical protein
MGERRFKESFRDAWAGISYSILTQRNMKVHLAAAVLVLLVSKLLRLNRLELALVVFAITLVLVAEMFNTAVELRTWRYQDGKLIEIEEKIFNSVTIVHAPRHPPGETKVHPEKPSHTTWKFSP